MERLVKGDIVVVHFPFSDLSSSKKRPALVIGSLAGSEYLLCQITSNSFAKQEEISLKSIDFINGKLKKDSLIRFTKLFTSKSTLIEYLVGKITPQKMTEITNNISKFIG